MENPAYERPPGINVNKGNGGLGKHTTERRRAEG
jgi:hypothetical protein